MKLKELIKKATPLPWRLNESHRGYTGHSIIVNASKKSANDHDIDSVRVLDKAVGGYVPEVIERYQRDFTLLVHAVNILPELVEGYTGIADAAQGVIDNWEKGDLAEAVRSLDCWITCAREQLAKANNINIEQKGN
jgi:hypothetical protein